MQKNQDFKVTATGDMHQYGEKTPAPARHPSGGPTTRTQRVSAHTMNNSALLPSAVTFGEAVL
eukprot:5837679-Prymnesium_polylepis.1